MATLQLSFPSVPKTKPGKEEPKFNVDPDDSGSDDDKANAYLKKQAAMAADPLMAKYMRNAFDDAFLDAKFTAKTLAQQQIKETMNDLCNYRKIKTGCQRILNEGKVNESVCGKTIKKGSKYHFCDRHDREKRRENGETNSPPTKRTKVAAQKGLPCPTPSDMEKLEKMLAMYDRIVNLKRKTPRRRSEAAPRSPVVIHEVFDDPIVLRNDAPISNNNAAPTRLIENNNNAPTSTNSDQDKPNAKPRETVSLIESDPEDLIEFSDIEDWELDLESDPQLPDYDPNIEDLQDKFNTLKE